MSESIRFFNENINYKLGKKKILRKWIKAVVKAEQYCAGEINFILCDDDYLSDLNIKYLKHNTLTDIITFPFNEENRIINGEIYISLPRVRENASKFKENIEDELHRVMIHGILHLMGYKDSSNEEKAKMHIKENSCLSCLSEIES